MVSGLTLIYVLIFHYSFVCSNYTADWRSLDSRPLPYWYDDAKFGIFIHWGVYSVPSFDQFLAEWFWKHLRENRRINIDFMRYNYYYGFNYSKFTRFFNAEFFDPNEWADLFKRSGAKYVVLTSKHHEGYTLWPSTYSPRWNSVKRGPKRDLVGDLATAVRSKTDLEFGLYYSLYEWYHPLYVKDSKNNFTTKNYVKEKMMPEMIEMVKKYEPAVVWTDGEWDADEDYWDSKTFLAWLYNESPVKDYVVVNDRWGKSTRCRHGDFYTCEDNYDPGRMMRHKWERCSPIDKDSWGYRRNAQLINYLTIRDIITQLVTTVSRNGNLLLNIGPTKEGIIPLIMQERLLGIGSWLSMNGEAIYSTDAWDKERDLTAEDVWYTKGREHGVIYAIVLQWPKREVLVLASPEMSLHSEVTVLGYNLSLTWRMVPDGVEITLPKKKTLASEIFSLKLSDVITWSRD